MKVYKVLLILWHWTYALLSLLWMGVKNLYNTLASTVKPSNFFHYDNVLSFGSLLFLLWLFRGVTFEILNPISEAFTDVQMTDLSYSQMGKNSSLRQGDKDDLIRPNPDITIVNIGDLNRYDVAEYINYINNFNPKVVALDVSFSEDKGMVDMLLVDELKKCNNLVMPCKILNFHGEEEKGTVSDSLINHFENIVGSHEKFDTLGTRGFTNMVTSEGKGAFGMSITREFLPYALNKNNQDTVFAWAIEIVRKYDPKAFKKLIQRHNPKELINYVGNINVMNALLPEWFNKNREWRFPHFNAFDYRTLEMAYDTTLAPEERINIDLEEYFKDKIVLVGYLGKRIDIDESGEDLFYTPLNERYVGRTPKDMYGVVVHANIIANVLRGDYIEQADNTLLEILGAFLTYFVFTLYRPIYKDYKIWYDGITKLLSILITLGILWIIGKVFEDYNYKLSVDPLWFGCILLAGDWLELYHGFIKNSVLKMLSIIKFKF